MIFGLIAVLLCAPVVIWRLLARTLIVVTVQGMSMEPTYSPGDRVLVRRGKNAGRGEVVVVEPPAGSWAPDESPGNPWMIKRVLGLPGDPVPHYDRGETLEGTVPPGMLFLLGDNTKVSLDSRQMGFFSTGQMLGTVLCRL
ncbi:S26 family signal peptidase [Streptomyces paludis]|uniref:Peptidase S26 domain-containing protein n=1 Tax=Streptomyces paludis TaxID=2282738 RepID=A0A345HNX1_9ACTN|nr:S26 family signal peptidase [Streptomyces paludis]AXG78395.1 hypothetical protein DVK44_12495 [Streptomyces paludis]